MIYYSVREASEILGVKVRTVRSLIAKKKLKARKDKRSKRWKISEVNLARYVYDHKR